MSPADFLVDQVARAGQGDDGAFRWVEARMRRILAHGVAYFAPTPMEYPDRWQIARIALFRACQSYDWRLGSRFTDYLRTALRHAYRAERKKYSYRLGRARFVSLEYLESETDAEGVADPGPDRFAPIFARAMLAAVYRVAPPDARVRARLESIAAGSSIATACRGRGIAPRAAQTAFLRWKQRVRQRAPHLFGEG